MTPCKFFAQSHCKQGGSCRFSHEATVTAPQVTQFASLTSSTDALYLKSPPAKPVCWYFLQGRCTYGSKCINSHELKNATAVVTPSLHTPTEPQVSTSAPSKLPAHGETQDNSTMLYKKAELEVSSSGPWTNGHRSDWTLKPRDSISCRFFGIGFCRNGNTCPFSHDFSKLMPDIQPLAEEYSNAIPDLDNTFGRLSISENLTKEFHSAIVIFKAGGEVSKVKLESDFSTIQIAGLPVNAKRDFVMGLLSELGFPAPESKIMIKQIEEGESVAEVRVEDANFSRKIIQEFERHHNRDTMNGISIKKILGGSIGASSSGSRLQLSTVTCTWYESTRTAWLEYGSRKNAIQTRDHLQCRKILGRVPKCTVYDNTIRGERRTTLQVSNLYPKTSSRDILNHLPASHRHLSLRLCNPTEGYSGGDSGTVVERLLQSIGALESPLQFSSTEGSGKVKGIATFVDREKAALAVRTYHDTRVSELGDSMLMLTHVISVKYNVSIAICKAIKPELDELRKSIWSVGHVQLKVYPQTDLSKPFNTVRLFGESIKTAKAALEKLIAGNAFLDGEVPLWNSYFLTADGLTYLNDLSKNYKVYIFRDTRKLQLLMYGGKETTRNELQQVLVDKVDSLQKNLHTITLDPDLLKKAMQGGMGKLKSEFGDAVTLNISLNPKTITFKGSLSNFHVAMRLLIESAPSQSPNPTSQQTDCIACWTEAIEPIRTSCGHLYCKDCFANQASSVSESDLPLHCFGAEGTCDHIFSIEELKSMLSPMSLEKLFQVSFTTHIRSHPKEFQYCPTPDCPQIYRLTKSGDSFLCSTCLAVVCTTCNVLSHDGMTCQEYKEISSDDGSKALQRWAKENDARSCPVCKILIQKSEGCNHMTCKQCKAHICWFCMKNFKTARECYEHMQNLHDNFYGD
ncbi:hypothetical protein BGZ60DRAFT_564826 [Tricladium varicosporioides]|nr:hypothetical protein BGZ60DRAFT_564826 [Hymenoscyphus varicosporioides]